jgi:hypothetical protein
MSDSGQELEPPSTIEDEDSDDSKSRSDTSAHEQSKLVMLPPFSNPLSAISEARESRRSRTALTEALENAEAVLDQLIRVGFAIRKFGTDARLQKADASFNPNDYGDFRQYLSLILLIDNIKRQHESLPDDQAKDKNWRMFIQTLVFSAGQLSDQQRHTTDQMNPNPQLLSPHLSKEQEHLINANLRRRHRFVCARKHGKRLTHRAPLQALNVESEKTKVWPGKQQGSEKSATVSANVNNDAKKPTPDMAGMTATSVSAGPVIFDPESLERQPMAATVVSTTVQKLEYPRAPPVYGMIGFTCPCCLQTLPSALTERHRWRFEFHFLYKN